MRRVAPVVVLGGVLASVALAAPTTGAVTVKASSSALGTKIVVSATGLTLYHFVPETKGTIKCTGACSTDWPPLVVAAGAKPVAGPGLVAAKLGTIKRPDGRMQVTYNGLALYRYSDDHKSGQLEGQGEAGIWFAVTPAGTITKAHATTSAATTNQPATGGTTAGGGGGYGAGGDGGMPGGSAGSGYNY
jgi:predicted lipoprotein with Yx(FWY)xxD motif